MSELRRDREWQHWPQERRLDDSIRRKLRGLFHPTLHDGNDVEGEIAAQAVELESRARQLAETIADLETREERTRELRTAVEQMLRRGSAELDERHGELTDLAARLADREARAAEAETALAERRRELGAVELRRAALERREEALSERERMLSQRAEELLERERELAARLDAVAERERASEAAESRVAELDRRDAETSAHAAEVEALQARVAETLVVIEREQAQLAAREAAVTERERLADELDRRAHELDGAAEELRSREASLAAAVEAVESGREELRQTMTAVSRDLGLAVEAGRTHAAGPVYVALVPGDRYRLVERDDGPAEVGMTLDVEGLPFRVVRLGSSPLPGDRRRCAYLEPEARAEAQPASGTR
jgi:DNA repair exonuclease SbcCD ATPase subunit